MHFCSSSRYVMWQAFCSLQSSTYTSKYFQHCLLFFSAVFFSHFPPHANSSPLSGFCTLHQVFCSGFWSSSLVCHVSRSSISGLCIYYLTTNNFMLTFWIYEIWDTIFIQFILIFVLLYFSNFLLCSIKMLQATSSSIFANRSKKALLH